MKDLQQRAQAFGFTYIPVSEIVEKLNGEQIVERVTALGPPYLQNSNGMRMHSLAWLKLDLLNYSGECLGLVFHHLIFIGLTYRQKSTNWDGKD